VKIKPQDNVEFMAFAATVKAVGEEAGPGEFEAIISTDVVDRDGEAVATGALDPLPESIPVYYQHDWRPPTNAMPVAKAVPFYDGPVLKAKGTFASTERGQEMRTLVNEGVVDSMSIGFLNAKRETVAGQKSVTKAELFEVSFTAIPINTTAKVLASKALMNDNDVKAGARNSAADTAHIQSAHDHMAALGATCDTSKSIGAKSLYGIQVAGSYEERIKGLREQLQEQYATDDADTSPWIDVIATTDSTVVYEVNEAGGPALTYQADYQWNDGEPTIGAPAEVDVSATVKVEPASSTASAADQAAAGSPAAAKSAAGTAEDEASLALLETNLLVIDALVAAT
jgi:HK97 family phage prohead protease